MISQRPLFASLNGIKVPKRPCTLDTERPDKGWWSYKRFIREVKLIHEDRFEYPDLKDGDPIKSYSQIRVVCKRCSYESELSVSWHVDERFGCIACENKLTWTRKTFHKNAKFCLKENYDKYEFHITEDMIRDGSMSPLHVRCRTCKRRWFPTIHDFVLNYSGCKFEKVHPMHLSQ